MTLFEAIVLAVVEGLTEYLPVSSTGHLIITSALMGIGQESFTKDYTIIVQFGAILSVLVIYWKRFLSSWQFYQKLFVAFLPAAVVGLFVKDQIDALLGNVIVVAVSLIAGGVVLIFIDSIFAKQERHLNETNGGQLDNLKMSQAFFIGVSQCLAFVPGVSRAAASIVGGLTLKLTRKAAAEFSFFLAVPTLTGATLVKVLKVYKNIQPEQISILLIGNLLAFVVASFAIKSFIGFLTRRGFFWFGVYRVFIGIVILALMASGYSLQPM